MTRAASLTSIVLTALIFGNQANGQTSRRNTIVVEHPWARATPAGAKTGAVYGTLANNGSSGERLLSATTPVADRVQFHSVSEENGVSRMREMHAVEIAAGAKAVFSPGGMHIMVVGLKQPLKQGQTFPLTLIFDKAGAVEVIVSVAKVGAMQHGDMAPMSHEPAGAVNK